MRVISGKARGTKLECPTGDNVRPTTDRIKESLFNIINMDIIDTNVLDLFCGTGALGIESLSRGANRCVFVDRDKKSIEMTKRNILKTKLMDYSIIENIDVKTAISKYSSEQFDYIFLDPPYNKDFCMEVLRLINDNEILNEDGIIVIEHDPKEVLDEVLGHLIRFKEKKYNKTTMISFYKLEEK
ncbi:16S rRNA (guanine(966)-N(2))-methyltransferase RsmD [Peptostreptococcaceae bacterium AGR-M142]